MYYVLLRVDNAKNIDVGLVTAAKNIQTLVLNAVESDSELFNLALALTKHLEAKTAKKKRKPSRKKKSS